MKYNVPALVCQGIKLKPTR